MHGVLLQYVQTYSDLEYIEQVLVFKGVPRHLGLHVAGK